LFRTGTHAAPRKPRSFKLAIAGPALALVVLAGGIGGLYAAQAPSAHSGAGHSIALEDFAGSRAVKPSVSGSAGGSGARARRATARDIARTMMHHRFHWLPRRQFRYLNWLWNRESGWNVYASNPYSAAYGIPQAVPGSKMSSAGPNWPSSARTQIRWGLRYIRDRYGSPRAAWDHEVNDGWY
jgi:hypothetical protein